MRGRVIGVYDQGLPGPLLLCIGAMHGNETAGIDALELLFKMLEVEPVTNPGFEFSGRLVAFVGNLGALESGEKIPGPRSKSDLDRRSK